MARFHLNRRSPDEEFPDLRRNATLMGQILTPAMYRRQFHRCTDSGVIFDDVIRPGLEEPGERCGPVSAGCVAGDAQSYILFCDFFDRVIEAYHKHKVDRSHSCLVLQGSEDLDRSYVLGCEMTIVRSVEDYCFPIHCSRGERRQLLQLAKRGIASLQRFGEEDLPGQLHLLKDLDQEQQCALKLSPPSQFQLRTGAARDWPDARAVWLSDDNSLVVWINIEDHLKLVTTRHDADLGVIYSQLRHPFIWKQQLGWLSSSPTEVGTGFRVRIKLRLKLLPTQRRLQDVLIRLRLHMVSTGTASTGVYTVSNAGTFGESEVALTQLVVDGVKLLVNMEKILEKNGDIDELVPSQK
uniref:creatine kinase n=1 Tax=Cynoglossus semilaevis TaxID=244447 RepID=A0A3P8UHC8_CYNSE